MAAIIYAFSCTFISSFPSLPSSETVVPTFLPAEIYSADSCSPFEVSLSFVTSSPAEADCCFLLDRVPVFPFAVLS